jgi:tetratricopeptide (TPR) repeat protein
MSHSEDHLRDLLAQAENMPYGAAQIALVEQVVAHADAQHLADLSFAARMHATTSYVFGGEPARAIVTFSWCLAEFDREPTTYAGYQHSLLWHFKWVVGALTNFPEIGLDRTYAVLDDMERRWTATGHSLHAVYSHRHIVARHIGDLDVAEEYYRKWCTAPRDGLSDCVGCDPSSKVRWLKLRGRDEEAVALAEPVLAGTLTCWEQPQGILTNLLGPYLRTGRLEEARDAHRRAYRMHRPNLADLGDIADHIVFCARTGNEARGVEIVERHLGWLDRAPSPNAAMWFAASGALALRMAGTGFTVHRPAHRDRSAADVSGDGLAAELTAQALEIAGRFDARNRSTEVSRQVRQTLEADRIVDHLPLSPTAQRRPSTVVQSTVVQSTVDQSTMAHSIVTSSIVDGASSTPPVPAPFVVPEVGPDELLELIDELNLNGRNTELDQAIAAFAERFPEEGLAIGQRAAFGRWRAAVLEDAGDAPGAEAALRQAESDFASLGDEVNVQVSRVRLALLRSRRVDPEAGLAEAAAASEVLLAHASPRVRCDAALRLGTGLLTLGRSAETVSLMDSVWDTLDEVAPQDRARVMLMRLLGVSVSGRTDEVLEHGPATLAAMTASGLSAGLGRAHYAIAMAKQRTGDLAGAADHADAALANEDDPDARAGIRNYRARLLSGTDRAGEAIEDLADAVAEFTAGGDTAAAADTRHWLAVAYLNAGRTLDAAEVAEEELAYWTRRTEDEHAVPLELRCRRLLAAIYQRLEQPREAIAQLEQVVEVAGDDWATVGEALAEAGDILDRMDHDREAASRFLAAAEAFHRLEDPLLELRCRRRHALSLWWADEPEAAEALARAETVNVPDSPAARRERAMLDFDAARILSGERPDDAADRAGAAAAHFNELGLTREAAESHRLRARILLDADRATDAEAAARAGLADLPPQTRSRELAEMLVAALRAQGRDEEALEAWERYIRPDVPRPGSS